MPQDVPIAKKVDGAEFVYAANKLELHDRLLLLASLGAAICMHTLFLSFWREEMNAKEKQLLGPLLPLTLVLDSFGLTLRVLSAGALDDQVKKQSARLRKLFSAFKISWYDMASSAYAGLYFYLMIALIAYNGYGVVNRLSLVTAGGMVLYAAWALNTQHGTKPGITMLLCCVGVLSMYIFQITNQIVIIDEQHPHHAPDSANNVVRGPHF